MDDKILNNINKLLSYNSMDIFNPLEMEDLGKFYNDYSVGIDTIAKHAHETIKSTYYELPEVKKLPDEFPKSVNNNMLYRGTTERYPFFLMKPQTRVSKDTNNIYTLLISEILPSWENIPKRNKSIISTNSYNVAKQYKIIGRAIYNVIPINNADLVISGSSDFWEAFKNINDRSAQGLPIFNDIILKMMTVFNILMEMGLTYDKIEENLSDDVLKIDNNDFNKIKDMFAEGNISQIYDIFDYMDLIRSKDIDVLKEVMYFIYYALLSNDSEKNLLAYIVHQHIKYALFVDALDEILKPKNAIDNVIKYHQYNILNQAGQEIWTDSPCLLILPKLYNTIEFLEEYFKIVK